MSKCKELSLAVVESVRSNALPDLAQEYAEAGIDVVLTEGVLRDIPLVNTIVAIGKFGISISDRLLIKKLIRFLGPLHHLSSIERQKMITKLEST